MIRLQSRRRFLVLLSSLSVGLVVGVFVYAENLAKKSSSSGVSTSSGSSSPTIASSSGSLSASGTTAKTSIDTSTPDYALFVAPYVDRIERVRKWFMSPPDASAEKAGYNTSFGLIQGGFFGGQGYVPNGYDLIDGNFIPAKSLDYLNAASDVATTIESNVRRWLASEFVDPSTGDTISYRGNDRRETLFGKTLDCVRNGKIFYVPGHTPNDPTTIASEIPQDCTSSDKILGMNVYAMWIEQYYLQGQIDKALEMFSNTVSGFTPTPNTGVGGTTGGLFSDQLDPPTPCKNTRTLGYWTHMARATEFWDINDETRTVAQQVLNELWAHQLDDGGIRIAYPGCGSDRSSNESSGLVLVALDPRTTQWFGH